MTAAAERSSAPSVGKLIRDGVPARIRAGGGAIDTERLDAAAFAAALRAKLVEEAREVEAAGDREALLEEIADVHEVLGALAAAVGISVEEIEAKVATKRTTHGGFDSRLRTVRWTQEADPRVQRP